MSGQTFNNQNDCNINDTADKTDLLLAVNKAAPLLLTVNDLNTVDDVLTSALEIIGISIKADRVHIWRDAKSPNKFILERQYSWVSNFGAQVQKVPVNADVPASYAKKFLPSLKLGKCIGHPISTLDDNEREYFASYGTKSICLIPLFCADILWGLISIDFCNSERFFTEEEYVTFKSLGLMVASVLNYQTIIMDLVKINERADAANKSKSAFLSNMSHEVRTPLNAIVGMTAIGRNSDSIDEKDYALSKIGDASSHLLDIISNVIEMARIENGTLEINPSEFNIRDVINKSISTVRPLASEKDQNLEIDIDDGIPQLVIGDEFRLGQLISNLLSNAVKFTPIFGSINLNIIKENETKDLLTLQITVTDNGIGIPEDQQGSVFVPFEQAQGALNRDFGGTGLGLPISKRIVELMDGRIWLESEPGRGTTVYLTIQLAKSRRLFKKSGAQKSADSAGDAGCAISPGEFKGKRLLIVEDVEINREIIIALLKESELLIDCAEDGQVAVDMVMFNVEKYDIIFMDLQMPNMGGLEAVRHIRMLPERKRGKLPIIAMTANTLPEDIKACLDAGMDDHLSKPLDIDKVINLLRKYLK